MGLRFAARSAATSERLSVSRLYIEGGLLVTLLGLVPTLLSLLDVPGPTMWRVASAAAALIFSFVLFVQFRRRRTVEGRFPPWVVGIFVISSILVLALWLNVAGIFFRPSVGPYALTLTWALAVFGFTFIRTIEIFLHRDGNSPGAQQ